MPQGTDASHAVGDSIVPQKLQEVLPQAVEEKVPNSIHDTGSGAEATSNAGVTHATGDSAVPKPAQEAVPKGLEEALPEKARIASRCYSTATEAESGEKIGSTEPDVQNGDQAKKELEAKDKEIIELKDKYLRSVADFRNLQDRTKREIDSAKAFAITRFAGDLVESVDNLDRALGTVPAEKVGQADSNKDLVNLYEGLKMTDTILMQTLKKHGLERIDPAEAGDMFNPNLHEATFQTKVEGKEDGQVFMTQQKGFILNGRVVRAAKVGVVKNS